ncbi:hypothetical protein LSH36_333g00014 [Paralvinella palmiformis]|uniref:Hexosyltransferase n=1 Tax=Paralvinella palmiformis TaxID=53620 RepID=A0AAD9N269_9ANNE|nr:hypothetical protein LSH36_333g00014 [Paralvinella palmiformis]
MAISGWLWLSIPVNSPSDVLHEHVKDSEMKESRDTSVRDTRQHTAKKANIPDRRDPDNSSELSHHHSNHSLEKLRKNMTLLKVNMSGLENIVRRVNRSQVTFNRSKHISAYQYANPHPFRYIINTQAVCRDNDIFLIVYVHTAPDHYKRRMVIRQTWGRSNYYHLKVRVVFIMGYTYNKNETQQALLFEAEQYHDLVQEDFADTYKNLTYKGIAGLKWISNYCPRAKFVLKTDDDIFVNMFTLLRHLASLDRMGVDNKGILLCLVWYRMTVMRTGKWKVSVDQWKDNYYPTYCSGSAFTMTMDVALAMYNVSYHVPFFWVDDFYITGLLPLKLGGKVKHKQFMSTYVLDGRKLEEKFTSHQWFTYIFSHVHDLNAIQSVWERVVKLARGETSATVKFALPGQLPKVTPAPKPRDNAKKSK